MTDALEVRLLRWSESSQAGRTVTFLLPEDGEHPFRGMKTGKTGDLFAMALARIEDPEAKADHIFPEGYTKGSEPTEGQKAVTRAVMLCKSEDFQRWIGAVEGTGMVTGQYYTKEQNARTLLCRRCDIPSRRDLAVNPEAVARFRALETDFKYRDTRR